MPNSIEERVELLRSLSIHYRYLVYLDSNDYPDLYGKYSWLIMAGNKPGIEFTGHQDDWDTFSGWIEKTRGKFRTGFFGYATGSVQSNMNEDGFPLMGFFEPEFIRGQKRNGDLISVGALPENSSIPIQAERRQSKEHLFDQRPQPRINREEYTLLFEQIRDNLLRGNIYEVNFCQPFEAIRPNLDAIGTWEKLNRISPAPFASLIKYNNSWVLGSSPERFMCKRNHEIISQPIKGTCKRTGDLQLDKILAEKLANSGKERSENIMTVDLVRNDLSSTLIPGSVHVTELCGIYSFARVQHMITTIQGRLIENDNGIETIHQSFPMGSMTGAPKIRAMEIAHEKEPFNRGIYSGSIGLFDPDEDFDLNVVIRSIAWNGLTGYLRFATGSAVTVGAEASAEYEECLLKAESMFECLLND